VGCVPQHVSKVLELLLALAPPPPPVASCWPSSEAWSCPGSLGTRRPACPVRGSNGGASESLAAATSASVAGYRERAHNPHPAGSSWPLFQHRDCTTQGRAACACCRQHLMHVFQAGLLHARSRLTSSTWRKPSEARHPQHAGAHHPAGSLEHTVDRPLQASQPQMPTFSLCRGLS
jgi:hypothetical protein